VSTRCPALAILEALGRILRAALYDHSVSCFRTGGIQSPWFNTESGVRQGCVLAPDSFATGMDCLLERMVGSGATLVSFGQASFTDLDFADDVSLLAELLELLVPALELMADEAASLGLEVNWQKTVIQALGRTEGVPLTVTVKDHEVTVADEFVYLGSLIPQSKAPMTLIAAVP